MALCIRTLYYIVGYHNYASKRLTIYLQTDGSYLQLAGTGIVTEQGRGKPFLPMTVRPFGGVFVLS